MAILTNADVEIKIQDAVFARENGDYETADEIANLLLDWGFRRHALALLQETQEARVKAAEVQKQVEEDMRNDWDTFIEMRQMEGVNRAIV